MSLTRKKKVLVAMSGGVDSAVAAALLREEGHEVVGCFMRHGAEQEDDDSAATEDRAGGHRQGCCSVNDACDARLVAAMLDVPLYVLNFKADFERIIDYFVDEYNDGRTPNPCIRCNTWLKFGKLAEVARSIDADHVATGHHARLDHHAGRIRLLRGADAGKDQSYVLFGTPRSMLGRMLLPVGRYTKRQIRDIAADRGLPVSDKPDSQEICFVPDNDYMGLVRRRSADRVQPGKIVDDDGNVLGEHDGHQGFTIGQRRGLSLSLGHPIYVVDKNPTTNTVTVGTAEKTAAIGLVARQTNWLRPPDADTPQRCAVKIRANSPARPATMTRIDPDTLEIRFDEPQKAVSPGQAAVCYDGEELIGGGWIESAVRA